MQRAYLVPSDMTARPGESETLDVLAHVLGSGENSRLYRVLVMDKRLAVNAGADYAGTAVDATRFSISATPQTGTTLPQLEAAVDGVIQSIADNGITDDELERAKTRIIADAVYARDNQATMARWYGSALVTGATVDQVKTWPDRVRAVSADAVRDAARTWLQKPRSVTGYLVKDWHSAEAASSEQIKSEQIKPDDKREKRS
jgi:zinc protease